MTARHVIDEIKQKTFGLKNTVDFCFVETSTSKSPKSMCTIDIANLIPVAQCLTGELDYALIRLPFPVGTARFVGNWSRIRGWFPVVRALRNEPADIYIRSLAFLHYPAVKADVVYPEISNVGQVIFVCSVGETVNSASAVESPLLLHDAPTEKGSSGCICLWGADHEPLAMHIGTNGDYNKAVRLRAIMQHIRINFPAVFDDIDQCPLSKMFPRAPSEQTVIINRDQFINKLIDMHYAGDRKLLYASGSNQSGRTFLSEMIALCSGSDFNIHLDLQSHLSSVDDFVSYLGAEAGKHEVKISKRSAGETDYSFLQRSISMFLEGINNMGNRNGALYYIFLDSVDITSDLSDAILRTVAFHSPKYGSIRLIAAGSAAVPEGAAIDAVPLGPICEDDYLTLATDYRDFHSLHIVTDDVLRTAVASMFAAGRALLESSLAIQKTEALKLCQTIRAIANSLQQELA
jgi:hypothetical protein